MLTAPTWTYSAAGGPNPFIVPARGGFIATAVNTESGATIVGLGRGATRFARPLKLESRGVAIFAQPAPGHLPEHAWVVGYSTTAGIPPRLICLDRDGEVRLDVARTEVGWREGRAIAVTELPHGAVLHIDDRHLVIDARGEVVADLARPGADSAYVVDGTNLFAHDGSALVVIDVESGRATARVPFDGKPAVIRADAFNHRLAIRMERALVSLDLRDMASAPRVRALVGGLSVAPSAGDCNLRAAVGPPARIEVIDDDGAPRWSLVVGGATAVFGAGVLTGGELVLTATQAGGDRVIVARDGATIFERPRAGAVNAAGSIARIGERVALVIAPGATPEAPVEFSTAIDVGPIRGGGAIAYEKASTPGPGHRMIAVDAAGARALEVTEGGGGARWAAASDGLIAVPRTNAARIDLYDNGAPA